MADGEEFETAWIPACAGMTEGEEELREEDCGLIGMISSD